jgi:hypothetical protein
MADEELSLDEEGASKGGGKKKLIIICCLPGPWSAVFCW